MLLAVHILAIALALTLAFLGGFYLRQTRARDAASPPPGSGPDRLFGIVLCMASLLIGGTAGGRLARLPEEAAANATVLVAGIGFLSLWAGGIIWGWRKDLAPAGANRVVAAAVIMLVLLLVLADASFTSADTFLMIGLLAWLVTTAVRSRRGARR